MYPVMTILSRLEAPHFSSTALFNHKMVLLDYIASLSHGP